MEIVAEEWRPVAGEFAGWKYEVSNHGRVVSLHRKRRLMSVWHSPDGYLQTGLTHGDRKMKARINRLVAMAFVEGYAVGLEANHKDGDKNNNSPSNLEWVTTQENIEHSFRTGLRKTIGEYRRKMTFQDAQTVRELLRRGVKQTFLARWFGVTPAAISCIKRGITYQS